MLYQGYSQKSSFFDFFKYTDFKNCLIIKIDLFIATSSDVLIPICSQIDLRSRTLKLNSVISNNLKFKYQRFTPLGLKM